MNLKYNSFLAVPETATATHRWKWKYENEFKWLNHINGEQRNRQEESLIKSDDWRLFVLLRQDAINKYFLYSMEL